MNRHRVPRRGVGRGRPASRTGGACFFESNFHSEGGWDEAVQHFEHGFVQNWYKSKGRKGVRPIRPTKCTGGASNLSKDQILRRRVPESRLTLRTGACAVLVHARRGVPRLAINCLLYFLLQKPSVSNSHRSKGSPNALMGVVQKTKENAWFWSTD